MEVLCKSDYQDIYRVKDGVLLVINKFKRCKCIDGKYSRIGYSMKHKKYATGCQDTLCTLTEDYYYSFRNEMYYAGQVVYEGCPVELAPKEEWEYQIKTTGNAFKGNTSTILTLLSNIIEKVVE